MAPLSRLTSLPEETRRALTNLQLRSDTHACLRACERAARHAADPRASPATYDEPRVDPIDSLLAAAAAGAAARVVSGLQLDARCRAAQPLSTGSAAFDELLGGGLRRGEVVELSGPPASGKTQLCLSAAACASAAGARVLFLDSTGGFSASRVVQLQQRGPAGRRTADEARAALDAVHAARVFDVHAAMALLDAQLRDGGDGDGDGDGDAQHEGAPPRAPPRPALLVCDSASALVAPLLNNAHAQGRALMLSLAGALRALADEHDVAVLITNHTVSGRDDTGSLKPALGETWKSQPHVRVHLTLAAPSAARVDVHSAEVTLGRGRGRRAQYMLATEGLPPPPRGGR